MTETAYEVANLLEIGNLSHMRTVSLLQRYYGYFRVHL